MIPTNGKIKFKPGDIVFFKKEHIAKYGCKEPPGTYEYKFKIGKPYRIESINDGFGIVTGNIIDLEDGKSHFLHNILYLSLISTRDWNLNQLI